MNTDKTAYAPGQWRVTEIGVRDDGGLICISFSPTYYPGQSERYEKEVAERKAKLDLIAAAPDLLKALRDIHAMTGVSQGAAIIASAAIFQATGELP